jgi:propanediol dehydratase small subunit
MNTLAATVGSTALMAALLTASPATADGSGSSTWPADLPLPTNPGTVTAQSDTTAVVRSTDTVLEVKTKLDDLYITQKGCTRQLGVNKPRDYLCHNTDTGKTDEVLFTFAALDPTERDTSRSQTNAFYSQG